MKRFLELSRLAKVRLYLPKKHIYKHLVRVDRGERCFLKVQESFSIKIKNTTIFNSVRSQKILSRDKSLSNGLSWIQILSKKMSNPSEILNPPLSTKGMKILDKAAFKKQCRFPGLKIPVRYVGKLNKKMKQSLVKIPRLKCIAELGENDAQNKSHKLFLFDPAKIKSYKDFSDEEQRALTEFEIDFKNMEWFDTELGYDNWSAAELTRAVLPDHIEDGVTGFSIVGHIAHLNLKDEVLEYKHVIGEILLEKNPSIRTVVNKLNVIDNTFRNFQMELLAGEQDYITTARENGCAFEFDFSKVYWNSRLGSEHKRLVDMINKGDVLYDVFAGVGPFSILAAKKGIEIIANDLNPESFKSLVKNIKLNKISAEVKTFNMDGREFITTVLKDDLIKRLTEDVKNDLHVAMNLPALALEFLDAYKSLLSMSDISGFSIETIERRLPFVHCYCFTKSGEPEKDVQERAESILGMALPKDHVIRYVRNVAPNKEMMCLSFKLFPDLIIAATSEPDAKKQKLS
ncbi:tRNA (guanine(37)-N1)-methyltransferase [Patella vulgata]|uniref:tRNA (guanine(37)-N1)-methyltransferase n=1 Tax=Patella vulgata TaxID=6465 RepID=UPI0021806D38|nr:tRNA (guanine(37)-N1)-methyltransferase [Patella vulgata]